MDIIYVEIENYYTESIKRENYQSKNEKISDNKLNLIKRANLIYSIFILFFCVFINYSTNYDLFIIVINHWIDFFILINFIKLM